MIGDKIKELRLALGYTQVDLAYLSKVSLPSIQNIEARKANPSWDTIEKILNVMGLELSTNVRGADWEELARLGVPITGEVDVKKTFKPSAEKLIKNIKTACLELSYDKNISNYERKKEAVQALLLAVKHHYPSFFKANISRSQLMLNFMSNNIDGRQIKLQRIALSILSSYL